MLVKVMVMRVALAAKARDVLVVSHVTFGY